MLKSLDLASAGLAVVVFALAVATIVEESAVILNLAENSAWGIAPDGNGWITAYWPRTNPGGDKRLEIIPKNYLDWVTKLILAAGSICAAASVITGKFVFSNLRATSELKTRCWGWAACSMSCIAAILSLATLIIAFVEESTSSTWHYTQPDSSPSRFTVESWTCQMKYQFQSDRDDWSFWSHACSNAIAGRWLTVPLAVFSIALAVLNGLEVRRFSYQRANVDDTSEPKVVHPGDS